VTRRLPGVPIDARYETWQGCPYDEKEFGGILNRLHGVTPSGWGPIDDGGYALFDSWPSFLIAAARSALRTAREQNAIEPELCDHLEAQWLPRLSEVACGLPALLHMESLGFANILYDPGTRKISGLVDYEDCIGGDPLLEFLFMRFYFEHDDEGSYERDAWLKQKHFDFERFALGYENAEDDAQRVALYRPFPYLDKLRWIDPESPTAASYRRELAESI
jgi:aminoglycoside phosphotransferase (APT) family kinase protein